MSVVNVSRHRHVEQETPRYPEGIEYVVVNGVVTVAPTDHAGGRPGRGFRGPGGTPREWRLTVAADPGFEVV
jgi:hypothetical protein